MSARTNRRTGSVAAEEATGGEGTFLINTTVVSDLGVGGLEMHPVLGGACVPPGEDSSEVRVSVLNAVEHGTSRDILDGPLEVKGNQHSSGICLSKILGDPDSTHAHHAQTQLQQRVPARSVLM